MIEVKQAAKIAEEKAVEMLGAREFALEEIERELYKDRDAWSITLSFPRKPEQMSGMARLMAEPVHYKRFLIDVETGELLAMKLREVATR